VAVAVVQNVDIVHMTLSIKRGTGTLKNPDSTVNNKRPGVSTLGLFFCRKLLEISSKINKFVDNKQHNYGESKTGIF